jgi:serine/threonine protein kinase
MNECQDEQFVDFIDSCLDWNPITRLTPLEALQHEWILSGLPEQVLQHHKAIFNGRDRRDDI